jgi:hypothetical protein
MLPAIFYQVRGAVYPTIYDNQKTFPHNNDPGSQLPILPFNRIFYSKERPRLPMYQFNVSFIIPKDIQYNYGNGSISYYTENGQKDGNGKYNHIMVGGINPLAIDDKEGPAIRSMDKR